MLRRRSVTHDAIFVVLVLQTTAACSVVLVRNTSVIAYSLLFCSSFVEVSVALKRRLV